MHALSPENGLPQLAARPLHDGATADAAEDPASPPRDGAWPWDLPSNAALLPWLPALAVQLGVGASDELQSEHFVHARSQRLPSLIPEQRTLLLQDAL
jgi:hypothetical protein